MIIGNDVLYKRILMFILFFTLFLILRMLMHDAVSLHSIYFSPSNTGYSLQASYSWFVRHIPLLIAVIPLAIFFCAWAFFKNKNMQSETEIENSIVGGYSFLAIWVIIQIIYTSGYSFSGPFRSAYDLSLALIYMPTFYWLGKLYALTNQCAKQSFISSLFLAILAAGLAMMPMIGAMIGNVDYFFMTIFLMSALFAFCSFIPKAGTSYWPFSRILSLIVCVLLWLIVVLWDMVANGV